MPNGEWLRWLRPDVLKAALRQGAGTDFRTTMKTESQAHGDAMRAKVDRLNMNLVWIRISLALLITLQLIGQAA